MPLSFSLATLTSSTGVFKMLPLTTLFTIPDLFSNTRKSSGPKNVMLVGCFKPSTTTVVFIFSSFIVGLSPVVLVLVSPADSPCASLNGTQETPDIWNISNAIVNPTIIGIVIIRINEYDIEILLVIVTHERNEIALIIYLSEIIIIIAHYHFDEIGKFIILLRSNNNRR